MKQCYTQFGSFDFKDKIPTDTKVEVKTKIMPDCTKEAVCIGSFDANNNMEGYGTTVFSNGAMYQGQLKANRRDGEGKYFYTSGVGYEGVWKNNFRNGMGTYFWKNGNKDVGEHVNSKSQGIHTLYKPDGSTVQREWKDNNLVRTL